jgi:hypothetical protein
MGGLRVAHILVLQVRLWKSQEPLGAGGVALSICFACGVLGEGLDKALLKRNRTKFDACRDSLLGDLGMRPRYTIIMAGL